jgi:hypothetical protein
LSRRPLANDRSRAVTNRSPTAMSEGTARSSTESSSGLDFEDTALTLRLPGSIADPDRKRASTADANGGRSPRAAPAPKYVFLLRSLTHARVGGFDLLVDVDLGLGRL